MRFCMDFFIMLFFVNTYCLGEYVSLLACSLLAPCLRVRRGHSKKAMQLGRIAQPLSLLCFDFWKIVYGFGGVDATYHCDSAKI